MFHHINVRGFMKKFAVCLLFLLTAIVVPAANANLKEAYAAYSRGDYEVAFKEFELLAEQGHALTQAMLGEMYENNGQGVPQDYKMAHMYFNISGANGFDRGSENRDKISVKMRPQQIEETQQMANEWMTKH